jgi:hypothetical protein
MDATPSRHQKEYIVAPTWAEADAAMVFGRDFSKLGPLDEADESGIEGAA